MITDLKEAGFTAAELLITLFIAAIFLFAGYQLYTQVNKDGADADKSARVSNVAYELLRKVSKDVTTDQCTGPSTVAISPAPVIEGVKEVSASRTISCPFGAIDVHLITILVSYYDGVSQKELEHATYTN